MDCLQRDKCGLKNFARKPKGVKEKRGDENKVTGRGHYTQRPENVFAICSKAKSHQLSWSLFINNAII